MSLEPCADVDASEARGFKKHVTPKNIDLNEYSKCMYSVSVGANRAVQDVIEAYVWAKEKKDYPISAILIGDSLYKITLCALEGLREEHAEQKAIQSGNELIEAFQNEVCTKGIEFKKTSDLTRTPGFGHALQRVEALFRSDKAFKDSLLGDACYYVERQITRGTIGIDKLQAIDLSVRYLKKEVAIYLVLAEQGWLVDFYLGAEIPTLAKIMSGEIPAAPDALKRRVNVGLQKKKSRQKAPRSQALIPVSVLPCAEGVPTRYEQALIYPA